MESSADASAVAAPGLGGNRNFRLLWLGQSVSVLGDQLYFLALPWLVLRLTGDAGAMASVLAIAAVPRAALMLVGGALTDRLTPHRVMLGSNAARFVVVTVLGAMVVSGSVELWMIELGAFAFGISDALFFPAETTLLPRLIAPTQLARGNALISGTNRLSLMLGPALAGVLIAGADDGAHADLSGVGLAFLIDGASFLVSVATLACIHSPDPAPAPGARAGTLSEVRAGFRHVRSDAALRALIPFFACMAFIAAGVSTVGLPALADSRFGSSQAFGSMLSGHGVGALLGAAAAGLLPGPPPERNSAVAMGAFACFGVGMCLLGQESALWVTVATMVAMGAFAAYGEITVISWIQARTPAAYLGRVMSVLMFCTMGLAPLSMLLVGAVLAHGVAPVFGIGGAIYVTLALASLTIPAVRSVAPRPGTTPTSA